MLLTFFLVSRKWKEKYKRFMGLRRKKKERIFFSFNSFLLRFSFSKFFIRACLSSFQRIYKKKSLRFYFNIIIKIGLQQQQIQFVMAYFPIIYIKMETKKIKQYLYIYIQINWIWKCLKGSKVLNFFFHGWNLKFYKKKKNLNKSKIYIRNHFSRLKNKI